MVSHMLILMISLSFLVSQLQATGPNTPVMSGGSRVKKGSELGITCKYDLFTYDQMEWLKDETVFTDSEQTLVTTSVVDSFNSKQIYAKQSADFTDSGIYTCRFVESPDVAETFEVKVRGVSTSHQAVVEVEWGQEATLTCVFVGDEMNVAWMNPSGSTISGGSSDYVISGPTSTSNSVWTCELTVKKVDVTHLGDYTCKAEWSGDNNMEIEAVVELKVSNKLYPNTMKALTVEEGSSAKMDCVFMGTKMDSFTWTDPQQATINNSTAGITVSGITQQSNGKWAEMLTISKVECNSDGEYTCKAMWGSSSISHTIMLNVTKDSEPCSAAYRSTSTLLSLTLLLLLLVL